MKILNLGDIDGDGIDDLVVVKKNPDPVSGGIDRNNISYQQNSFNNSLLSGNRNSFRGNQVMPIS